MCATPVCTLCLSATSVKWFRFETISEPMIAASSCTKQHWEVGTPFSFARSTNSTPPPQLTNAPTRPQRHKKPRDFLCLRS